MSLFGDIRWLADDDNGAVPRRSRYSARNPVEDQSILASEADEKFMRNVLGIAALSVSVAGIVVPVAMLYLIWAALVLATAATFLGSRLFSLTATVIALANLALLNPVLWADLTWEPSTRGVLLQTITSVLFLSPVAALVLSLSMGNRRPAAPKQ